jgi:beta-lactamase class A
MISEKVIVEIINQFCTVKDRSVRLKIVANDRTWEHGFLDDVKRPAASLVKILIATSVEERINKGLIDPSKMLLIGELIDTDIGPSILRSLDYNHSLSLAELIQVSISASDPIASRFLLGLVDDRYVDEILDLANLKNTEITFHSASGLNFVTGLISAKDALTLVEFGSNSENYPLTAKGLSNSILNSRIPLGIANLGTKISHKTGTLLSVAHDVALIKCREASLSIAFLTENQDDTLQTGYEMGICTRRIIESLDYYVEFSRSYD